MSRREHLQAVFALGRQPNPYDALIGVVGDAFHQAPVGCPVDEFARAVVFEQHVLGDVTDARRPAMTSDGQKELMMRRREPSSLGTVLTPSQELSQSISKLE